MKKERGVMQVALCMVMMMMMMSNNVHVKVVRAEEALMAAPINADERQALHEEVIHKIESTKQLLQRAYIEAGAIAVLLNSTGAAASSCAAPLFYEISSVVLSSIEGLLLQDLASQASHQVSIASTALSACQSAIADQQAATASTTADNETTSNFEDNRSYILEQAISLLQATSFSLNRLESITIDQPTNATSIVHGLEFPSTNTTMVETEATRGRRRECRRDGTTCQFSRCGRGKRLRLCAMGFAYGVTGGAAGPFYVVTRSDDNQTNPQPGSLRYAVGLGGGSRGVWITFANSMIIELESMLWIQSSTTVDGRGVNVTINGRMLVLRGVNNVILHNFQINSMAETDTVHIFAGSTKVWVDHVTSFDAKLGLISVVQKSTDVTISNCKLSNQNFNMLLGAADADVDDKNMRVTVYRNWFKDSRQRMPHCRWGFCHVINNLYTNWGFYAIGGRVYARILSESNAFIAARRAEVTPWFHGANHTFNFDSSSQISSHNDLFLNGSTFHQFGQPLSSAGSSMIPPYRSAASYPPLLPNIRALPDFVRSCSGAIFRLYHIRECRRSAGFV